MSESTESPGQLAAKRFIEILKRRPSIGLSVGSVTALVRVLSKEAIEDEERNEYYRVMHSLATPDDELEPDNT